MEKIIDYSLYLCTDSNINKDYDIGRKYYDFKKFYCL